MARLEATLMDVGWGDSILLETESDTGERLFGLIDRNDTTNERVAFGFVKRRLERAGIAHDEIDRNFRFVLLTHGHADHHQGLKWMLEKFGTEYLWHPKSVERGSEADSDRVWVDGGSRSGAEIEPKRLLQVTQDGRFLFPFSSLTSLLARRLIPSQALLFGHDESPVFFSPLEVVRVGLP